MEDVWNALADGGCWTPRFYRRLNDWEVNMVEWFLFRLQGWRLCRDEEDKLLWIGVKNGNFFVHALYKALELGSQVTFLASVIWNSWVPPKVGFFAWEATWNKVLTLDHIRIIGWSMANRCFLCRI